MTVVTFWVFVFAILVLLLPFWVAWDLGYRPSSWVSGMFGDDVCSDLYIAFACSSSPCLHSMLECRYQ